MATLSVRLFAVLRERIGKEIVQVDVEGGGGGETTVEALLAKLRDTYPDHAGIIDRCRVAVNQEFSTGIVRVGDEVALIPPVSGGAGAGEEKDETDSAGEDGPDHVSLTRDPIDAGRVIRRIGMPAAGAQCVFLGVVRDHNEGRRVDKIQYEAYESMAQGKLNEIARQMRAQFPVEHVVLIHRLGLLCVGEASVIVAVSTGHRQDAFAACRWGIDRLKEIVPIWKKEFFLDGSAWVGHELRSSRRLSRLAKKRPR